MGDHSYMCLCLAKFIHKLSPEDYICVSQRHVTGCHGWQYYEMDTKGYHSLAEVVGQSVI